MIFTEEEIPYDNAFAADGAKIGSTLRIRLPPNDYAAIMSYANPIVEKAAPVILSTKEVAVVGTAALVVKNPKVTRRFWSWSK